MKWSIFYITIKPEILRRWKKFQLKSWGFVKFQLHYFWDSFFQNLNFSHFFLAYNLTDVSYGHKFSQDYINRLSQHFDFINAEIASAKNEIITKKEAQRMDDRNRITKW